VTGMNTSSVYNTIEIVTHCWAGDLPDYARLLHMQGLSLLHLNKCRSKVTWTVFYHQTDELTVRAIQHTMAKADERRLRVNPVPLEKSALFRRAVGRNIAAKTTAADVVWFTDCDYLFQNRVLDYARSKCLKSIEQIMIWPREIMAIPKPTGARMIAAVENAADHLLWDHLDAAEPMPMSRAIGGIQIVKGEACRRDGYLDGTKWSKALGSNPAGFRRCRCDVAYRRQQAGRGEPVVLKDVLRVRHPNRGHNGKITD
jgi:hypothetical protein